MTGSAKVGWCEKLCYQCGSLNLQFINLLDFLAGCMFLIFSIYLFTKFDGNLESNSAWLVWSCVALGIMLLLTSMLSFVAITQQGCRCTMWMSSRLCTLLAVFEFAVGVAAFIIKKRFFNYLDDHGSSEGITTTDAQDIKNWYVVMACTMLGSCVVEILRFQLQRGFSDSSQRIDGEFGALLDEEESEWQTKLRSNNATRSDKYRDMRSHYKNKYAAYGRDSNDITDAL